MNMMVHAHPIRLKAPFYANGRHGELHRYFEPEFINLFQRDLQRLQLGDANKRQWKIDDAFSAYDQRPVLRLPMHKSFYLFSCEVVCDRPGLPALDPQHIASAGFVIRRLNAKGEQSWMIEDDQPLGWQPTPTGQRDPDVNRRCHQLTLDGKTKVKLRHAKMPPVATTYSGEQTHPLHVQTCYDADGKCHSLIYGYVSLGGTYMHRQVVNTGNKKSTQAFSDESLKNFSQIIAAQLLWPFGFNSPSKQVSSNQAWTDACTRPVNKGLPTLAFFELLKHLVNRYHLGEAKVADNSALQAWAEKLHFYQETVSNKLSPGTFNDLTRGDFAPVKSPDSLLSWLRGHFANSPNGLVDYIAKQEKLLDAGQSLQSLPGVGGYSLYMTPADAQELRNLLDQRALNMAADKIKEIPLPKFRQEREDVYQIVPFVRIKNQCGGDQIVWGNSETRSEVFRVAAPFDPNASRPSLIQMPSLADLRKGMAQGLSVITPNDTFNFISAMNMKKGASEDVIPTDVPNLGIQWICSFSLPVITLVAMIVLMIMISLLNIVFFWMPWVRICLPFPSMKKE